MVLLLTLIVILLMIAILHSFNMLHILNVHNKTMISDLLNCGSILRLLNSYITAWQLNLLLLLLIMITFFIIIGLLRKSNKENQGNKSNGMS